MGCAALLAAWGAATGLAHAQLFSPGPLARAHASLEGDTHCSDCHSSGRRVDNDRCGSGACHSDVAASVRARRGLHGREYRGQSCGECHVEHRGRGTHLVRWPGGGAESFQHTQAGWPLRGAHAREGCDACHTGRNRRGARTYLGLRQACASCHDDPHSARFGATCESCHSESSWSRVRVERFDHSLSSFSLNGAHASVGCADCHGTPPRYRGIPHSSCSSCHQDPHRPARGNCSGCHTETTWTDLGNVRANHPGLRLVNGHASVRCESCHNQGIDAPPSRGRACGNCHRAVHEASFGRNCARCHASIQWAPLARRIGLRAHGDTPFPLNGRHEEVACTECHDRSLPRQQRYRELTFGRCSDCHSDSHDGEFARRDFAGHGGGECASCHDESGFAPTTFGAAAHASTAFALEGRHTAVPCGGCHTGDRPRLSWRVTESRCSECHDSPHGDQFQAEIRAGGCEQCHNATGWDRPDIDHAAWPLTGAHELAACVACHSPSAEDRRTGQGASYRGVARECSACHEDEHLGQFRLTEPRRECESCHQTVSFEIADFDHRAQAHYPLVGRHREVDCGDCHPSVRSAGGGSATRWRLGFNECRDCHADPHAGGDQ